ncbi:hypothetical protein AM571_CH03322 [Rhizobium etli 8C-3]|uniref:DUF4376 domain-containing protein n=1 Tax=Rhizobium etli 8C-3 TaxID=538025 RepID=A0A1L5P7L9_RHIET|nr:DUF4376 domain-containing protein [Rhizobium etli]APO76116.1 hypothetical protein AM571_CH03322 [Rhizobium etli 8C-3]
MEYRNPVFSRADEGAIDMEIEHPVHGWIPFTALPNDVEEHGRELFAAAVATGNVAPYAPPVLPPPTSEGVDAERDRRITAGFIFNGFAFQSRPEDRENIMGASTAALAAMVNGAQPGDYRWHGEDSDFRWIDANNVMHPMDAQTVFAFGKAAMSHKQAHIFAARALKDMSPIPADYADDQHWLSQVA